MRIFFDFDNTVTKGDVLSDMIERYSVCGDWMSLENAWSSGEITTKECLKGQVNGIRISNQELLKYLKTVRIDPFFSKLVNLLMSKGIESSIVSDNFEPIIQIILRNNGIKDFPTYANHLRFYRDRFFPSFPFRIPTVLFALTVRKFIL